MRPKAARDFSLIYCTVIKKQGKETKHRKGHMPHDLANMAAKLAATLMIHFVVLIAVDKGPVPSWPRHIFCSVHSSDHRHRELLLSASLT